MKQYQFIKWFPEWVGFGIYVWQTNCGIYMIYEWCLYLGWFEVRKWVRPQDMERRRTAYNTASRATVAAGVR